MTVAYWPSAGQNAVVEFGVTPGRDSHRPWSRTGVVVADSAEEWSIELECGATELVEGALVTVSIFAPDGMYRMGGNAHYGRANHLSLVPIYGVERIQRRSWPRRALRVDVTLTGSEGGVGDLTGGTGRSIDISVGGLQVETVCQLPPGIDPTVTLTLPDGDRLVAGTRVVEAGDGTDCYRYRLAFNEIAGADSARLQILAGTSAEWRNPAQAGVPVS